jgi:hypothetical protein
MTPTYDALVAELGDPFRKFQPQTPAPAQRRRATKKLNRDETVIMEAQHEDSTTLLGDV